MSLYWGHRSLLLIRRRRDSSLHSHCHRVPGPAQLFLPNSGAEPFSAAADRSGSCCCRNGEAADRDSGIPAAMSAPAETGALAGTWASCASGAKGDACVRASGALTGPVSGSAASTGTARRVGGTGARCGGLRGGSLVGETAVDAD